MRAAGDVQGRLPKELLGPGLQGAVLKEARCLLEKSQATCQTILRAHRGQLDTMAQRLLEREVLSGEELKGLLAADAPQRLEAA